MYGFLSFSIKMTDELKNGKINIGKVKMVLIIYEKGFYGVYYL